MGEIAKGYMGKEDLNVQVNTDATETFDRVTSVGGTVAIEKMPDIWDGMGAIDVAQITLDGTVISATGNAAAAAFGDACKGFVTRPQFTAKTDADIYVGAGGYELNGKYVYWLEQLTCDIGTPDASDWYYLYLDDSALSASGLVTATELIWSNTEPAWSHTKVGQYNGNDRCIFAVLTDGTSDILEFFHDGNLVLYADFISARAEAALTHDSWTDVTLTIPAFAKTASVSFFCEYKNATAPWAWRTDGQDATTGHYIAKTEAGSTRIHNAVNVICSSAQKIEILNGADSSDTEEIGVDTDGWFFPIGL